MKISTKISLSFLSVAIVILGTSIAFSYFYISQEIKSEAKVALKEIIDRKEIDINNFLADKIESARKIQNSFAINTLLTKDLVETINLAKVEIDDVAIKVANEVNQYIIDHPDMTVVELQNDPEFKKIALQSLDIKGYTAVTNYDTLINVLHVNESLINIDLHTLAEKLPGFWSIIDKTEGGYNNSGFYDWEEPDGSIVKKYMSIETVQTKTADGIGLNVAATAYLDEFGVSMKISKEADEFFLDFNDIFNYNNIHIISSYGNIWWESDNHKSFDGEIISIENIGEKSLQDFYYQTKNATDIIVSELILDSDFNSPVFYINAPIILKENNEKIGSIILEIDVKDFGYILNDSKSRWSTNFIYLSNDDGALSWPISPLRAAYKDKNNELLQICFNDKGNRHLNKDEAIIFKTNQLNEYIGSHRYIPIINSCLIAEVTTDDAFAGINKIIYFFISIFLIIFTIVVFLIIFISKYVTRPIQKLEEGIKIVESGKLDYKVGINTNDEIGHLSRIFDGMTARLFKSKQLIEKRVKDQTIEIANKNKKLEYQNNLLLDVLKNTKLEKNKINLIVENIGEGIFVVDENNKITIFNKKAEEMSGYKYDEAIGRPFFEVFKFKKHREDKNVINSIDTLSLLMSDHKKVKNIVLKRKNRGVIKVSCIISNFKGRYDNIGGYVVIIRDITREVEIDKMKTEFVSLASHQLLTPLTGIKWFVDLLVNEKAGKINKKQKDFLNQVAISNERMIALVNDLLSVSHIETGVKFEIKRKETDISAIIKDSVIDNIDLAKKRKISISICPTKQKNIILNIDALKVRQVFNNLISNSIKYSKEGGKISIGCGKDNRSFFVKDNGMGIPNRQQNRVFQKFFRGDNIITKDTSGTGLGLYIAKGVMDAHGGKIWFESKENKGTTFYISF